ncbi:hypothetical protein [Bacillus pseudomycoides]|uniref:hypothetical protein n=1 Tax=Bacillus pseudomycoides TaxID=64104 RepID=UPI000BF77B9C|nr:hypothetical protein [Bacillus pseudomycoides]PEP47800.1 hypothetical protein CN564_27910 [Bacillus pseudomycoides]PHC86228.1 hypothetical protein COF36_24385 [Bacillus pseudomycoides]
MAKLVLYTKRILLLAIVCLMTMSIFPYQKADAAITYGTWTEFYGYSYTKSFYKASQGSISFHSYCEYQNSTSSPYIKLQYLARDEKWYDTNIGINYLQCGPRGSGDFSHHYFTTPYGDTRYRFKVSSNNSYWVGINYEIHY